jgi:hypothetical protein
MIPTTIPKTLLSRTHPDFDARFKELYFYRTTYEGSGPYAPYVGRVTTQDILPSDDAASTLDTILNRETALWRHPREQAKFERRVMQAYNVNVVRKIVNLLVGFLTRSAVKREAPSATEEWMKRVTPKAHSWDQWLESEVLPYALVYGAVPVLLHRPPSEAITAAQQRAEGAEVEACVISPECIDDWRMGTDGRYEWLRYWEPIDLTPGPTDEKKTMGRRWWFLTRKEWYYADDVGQSGTELQISGSGTWAELPIAVFDAGGTIVRSACSLQRELFNVLSLEAEQERETCFAMLTLPDPGASKKPRVVSTGSDNALLVPSDAKFQPAWLVPATNALEHYERKVVRLIGQIIEEVSLDFDEGASTGVAQSFKMSKVQRLLVHLAGQFARCEQEALDVASKQLGVSGEVKCVWPSRFDEADIERELTAMTALLALEVGPTFTSEARYRAAVMAMPDLEEDVLEAGWAELKEKAEEERAEPEESEPTTEELVSQMPLPPQSGAMQSASQMGVPGDDAESE